MCLPPWLVDAMLEHQPLPPDPVVAAQDLARRLATLNYRTTLHGRLRLVELRVEDGYVPGLAVLTLARNREALRRGSRVPSVEDETGSRYAIDLERGCRVEKFALAP